MKIKHIILPVLALVFLMYGCGDNMFSSIANDSSDEACMYQTSKDLDKGNYDLVVSSSCADSLQMGAAYLGMAGFDVKDVIVGLNDTQDSETALDDYLRIIIPSVSESSLNNLDLSAAEYAKVSISDESYEDAQLYISVVKAIRSLSLVKLVIDIEGDGITECDVNDNNIPDDVDAAACSLYVVAGQPCSVSDFSSVDEVADITIQDKSGTYKGLTITMNGTATESCPDVYKQLQYKVSGSVYGAATVTSETCLEESPLSGREWPCPIETGGSSLDLVEAFDEAITDGIDALGNSFTMENDLTESIEDIKAEACGVDGICTSADIAAYLNDQLHDESL